MTLTITLTPEKEARLAEQARAAGLTLNDYALRVLDKALERPVESFLPVAEPDSSPTDRVE